MNLFGNQAVFLPHAVNICNILSAVFFQPLFLTALPDHPSDGWHFAVLSAAGAEVGQIPDTRYSVRQVSSAFLLSTFEEQYTGRIMLLHRFLPITTFMGFFSLRKL